MSVLSVSALLLKMKTIVIINKVASTSTARMATIVPATSSPKLLESDTTIGNRGPVVRISPMISSGPVVGVIGRGGGRTPLPVAMLVGVGSGLFVGCDVCIRGETDKVTLGEMVVGRGSELLMLSEERDGGHE